MPLLKIMPENRQLPGGGGQDVSPGSNPLKSFARYDLYFFKLYRSFIMGGIFYPLPPLLYLVTPLAILYVWVRAVGRNRRGGGGRVPPEISAHLPEKRGKEK